MTTVIMFAVAAVAISGFAALTRNHTVTIYGAWERAALRKATGKGC